MLKAAIGVSAAGLPQRLALPSIYSRKAKPMMMRGAASLGKWPSSNFRTN